MTFQDRYAGYAYKIHPSKATEVTPIKVTDFDLKAMLENNFLTQAIEIEPKENIKSFDDFKFIAVFGRVFEIVEHGDEHQGAYKIRVQLDSNSESVVKLEAIYNAAKEQFELIYPYPYPMNRPAAYRPNQEDSIILLKREDKPKLGRFFKIDGRVPSNLKDGDRVRILSNWDPSAVQYGKPSR